MSCGLPLFIILSFTSSCLKCGGRCGDGAIVHFSAPVSRHSLRVCCSYAMYTNDLLRGGGGFPSWSPPPLPQRIFKVYIENNTNTKYWKMSDFSLPPEEPAIELILYWPLCIGRVWRGNLIDSRPFDDVRYENPRYMICWLTRPSLALVISAKT